MKLSVRFFLIMACCLFWSLMLSAQSDPRGPYYDRASRGIRFGWNGGQLTSPDSSTYYSGYINKFYVGFLTENRLLAFVHFGAGLEFYQNGSRTDGNNYVELSYFAIPLSLRINILNFYGRGGFTGALRITAREFQNGQKIETKGMYDSFDATVFASAGIQFNAFFLEIRRQWGLVPVTRTFRTRQWQIGGGFLF